MDAAVVAGYGLKGWTPPTLSAPLDQPAWERLLSQATAQRMTGLMASMVSDGLLPVSDDQDEALASAHVAALARDLKVERTVLWALQHLSDAGLDHRVLKGTAVAHLDYADPGLRSFVDADILVRSEEWDGAVEALLAAGARRAFPAPRPGWERRFAKCTMLKTPDGFEIDLHRTFVFGRFGITVNLDDLWESSETFAIGGVEVKALSPEARWMQTCFGAAVSDIPPRWVPLREVVQLSADGRLDLDRVAALTQRWKAPAVIRRAVRLVAERLPAALDAEIATWAETLAVTRSEEAAIRAHTNPGDRYIPLEISAFWAIRGLGAKVAYMSALLWPEESFLEQRYSGRFDRFRSALDRLAAAALSKGSSTARGITRRIRDITRTRRTSHDL